MKKTVTTLWCMGGLLLGSTLASYGQYTSSNWPTYPYDPAYELGQKELPVFRKPTGVAKFIPNRIPDYVWNQKVSKERILGPDGIQMIPVAPYYADQSETWIAINPANPNNIIASSNDSRYNGANGKYYMPGYYTLDGGQTWKEAITPENPFLVPNGSATIFDPGIFFDSQGRAYLTFGMTETKSGGLEGENGVFVSYSDDGGQSWQYVDNPVTYNTGSKPAFDDKYLSVADIHDGSPHKDNLYIVWTRFDNNNLQNRGIYISRSTDRGMNWSVASKVPGGNTGSFQSPVPAVGPEGNLYVAWRREDGANTEAVFQTSKDGGKNWVFPSYKVAQSVRTTGDVLEPGNPSSRNGLVDKQKMRISSYPALAVDASEGEHRGRIYIVQSGKDASSAVNGIYMTYSDDEGNTWSASKRIDNNPLGNDVFLPAVTVDNATGMVAALYYSSQNDPDNRGLDAYLAVSRDGGETFRHIRLTAQTTYINDIRDVSVQSGSSINNYWGDYTSIASRNGKIYPCYWMATAANGEFYSLDVFTNLLSNAPRPVENLAGSASVANPASVTLTWEDPARTMFDEELTDFTIAIYRRVKGTGEYTKIGEVPAGTETFEDNTTSDGVEYEYRVVAVSGDGQESADVVITVVSGGALKPNAPLVVTARPHANGIEVEFESPATHIDNTQFHDFHEVRLYSGEEQLAVVPVSGSSIQAGEQAKAVFEVPVGRFYNIRLKAVGKRNDKITESDASNEILAYAGAPLAPFTANFDSETDTIAYYTQGGTQLWGRTSKAAKSQPNSLTDSPDGEYQRSSTSEIILAPGVVQSGTSLSFEHIALVDESDMAEVFVSNNFGKNWRWMANYNKNSSSNFNTSVDDSDWETTSLDVSQYEGDTLYVMFRITSDFRNGGDGWYIDDIRFDNLTVDVSEQPAAAAYLGSAYPNPVTGMGQIEYRLRNDGHVRMELVNSVGVVVATLMDDYRPAGEHVLQVDANNLPNGLYFYRMTLENGAVLVGKMSVVR